MSGAVFVAEPHSDRALTTFVSRANLRWRLTKREAEVLYHLCRGLTNGKEVAGAMGIGASTERNFRTALYRRLGVNDMTAAVMAAWREFMRAKRNGG